MSHSVAVGKYEPYGCSDGVKKQLQVVLAEPVHQDVLLSFQQQRNHHQRVNVDDEAKDRRGTFKIKYYITIDDPDKDTTSQGCKQTQ